jgi:3-hydroxy-3-methylglutaryl CoA synthase
MIIDKMPKSSEQAKMSAMLEGLVAKIMKKTEKTRIQSAIKVCQKVGNLLKGSRFRLLVACTHLICYDAEG